MNRRAWTTMLVLALAACAPPPPAAPAPPAIHGNVARRPLDREAQAWVEATLEGLSLRQKVGQMIMPWIDGGFLPTSGAEYDTIAAWVRDYAVGGLVVSIGPPVDMAAKLNQLQGLAQIPLLIATDMEHGPGQRLTAGVVMPYGMDLGGGTRFPPVMALGATGDPALAYEMGRITALEARAVGIHMSFSPVVDVNNNPSNPIINTRSYGEDPAAVARMATAQLRGMQENGLLATAKHFPGHGDTSEDSHIELPRLDIDRARADSVELVPFRAAIEDGVSAVMSAHIAFPALSGDSALPATLSPRVLTGLLRNQLGFHGIVVTDALNMGAIVRTYGAGDAAVRAVDAGADILLMPDVPAALQAVESAVLDGTIDEARIDRSVRKLLEAKARVGLNRRRTVDLDRVDEVVDAASHDSVAHSIAERSITVARDREHLVPLATGDSARVLSIVYTDDLDPLAGRAFNRTLADTLPGLQAAVLYGPQAPAVLDTLLAAADSADRVVVSTFVRVLSSKGDVAVDTAMAAFIDTLAARRPTVVVAFGNPYVLAQFPEVGSYVLAWGSGALSQTAAARALLGQAPVTGRLPISIPPDVARGAGLRLNLPLTRATPAEVGMDADALDRVDAAVRAAITAGVTPGAALAVGRHGRLVRLTGFGRTDRREGYAQVTDSTIYDMASLTKVVATTSSIMALVSDGLLDIDAPVSRYLDEWGGGGKDSVTVRDLLLHRAGFPPYEQLWQQVRGADAVLDRVEHADLIYTPRDSTVYSDFDFITLGALVARVSGLPLDVYAEQRVFGPLGLRETGFNPLTWELAPDGSVVSTTPVAPASSSEAITLFQPDDPMGRATPPDPAMTPLSARIAPTEVDTVYRFTHIHGVVHDENAYASGGVSGHAGLFSSARDLARVAEMLLDGGAYAGRRILDGPVVMEFTRRQSDASSRALGWDTPAPGSSSGSWFTASSFGHTGFTGTSMWMDRERDVFLVLLTNRVNPTRAEQRIGALRRQVADLVQQAITDMPVAPREDAAGQR